MTPPPRVIRRHRRISPGTFSDPPTQTEMQTFAACVETLRAALVR